MTELREWSCYSSQGSLDIIDQKNLTIFGKIYGDPRFSDGSPVITSQIISINGKTVVTQSGTLYLLSGLPEKEWLNHCKLKGWEISLENPIESFLGFLKKEGY
tara:strand:- start:765 stop:1073 length:309 start_codon:yes stop_codon:yes gene_type:complete